MTTPIKDGGPAFPHGEIVQRVTLDDGRIADRVWEPHPGMTLRDYFAAKAMQGFISVNVKCSEGSDPRQTIAIAAYMLADAMLKEREQKR